MNSWHFQTAVFPQCVSAGPGCSLQSSLGWLSSSLLLFIGLEYFYSPVSAGKSRKMGWIGRDHLITYDVHYFVLISATGVLISSFVYMDNKIKKTMQLPTIGKVTSYRNNPRRLDSYFLLIYDTFSHLFVFVWIFCPFFVILFWWFWFNQTPCELPWLQGSANITARRAQNLALANAAESRRGATLWVSEPSGGRCEKRLSVSERLRE